MCRATDPITSKKHAWAAKQSPLCLRLKATFIAKRFQVKPISSTSPKVHPHPPKSPLTPTKPVSEPQFTTPRAMANSFECPPPPMKHRAVIDLYDLPFPIPEKLLLPTI